MKRREFLKAMTATGVAAAASPMFMIGRAEAADKVDIGAVKSVKVDVISETSWFDNDKFKANMTEGGGASTSQYSVAWDPENAGGYSALITVTTLEGEEKKILLDSGWSNAWMDYVFEKKGIPDDAPAERDRLHAALPLAPRPPVGNRVHVEAQPQREDRRTQDLLPRGHGASPGEGALHREGQGRTGGAAHEERLPAQGRAHAHRPGRPRGHRPLQGHAGGRGEDVRRPHPAPRAWRERPVLQREGQGRGHGHRVLPPGHPLALLVRTRQPEGLPAIRLLRRAPPLALRDLGSRSSTTSSLE